MSNYYADEPTELEQGLAQYQQPPDPAVAEIQRWLEQSPGPPPAEPAAAPAPVAPPAQPGVPSTHSYFREPAAVPRQGVSIPGAELSDEGQLRPIPAPTLPQPRRLGRGLPQQPELPTNLKPQHGGFYYPEDYVDRVMDSDLPPERKTALLEKYSKHQDSLIGLEGRSVRERQKGAEARAGMQQEFAGEQQQAFEQVGSAMDDAAQQEQQAQAKFETFRTSYREEQDKRAQQMRELDNEIASTKIDPSRAWKNKHPAATIMSMIGIALGGFAHGFSGGKIQNTALQMMQKEIDRDIDAQKSDLANRRASLAQKKTLYGMARERFGDEQMAHQWALKQMWAEPARAAKRMSLQLQGQKAQMGAQLIAQQAEEQAQLADLELKKLGQRAAQQMALAKMRGAAAKPKAAPGQQWKKAGKGQESTYVPWLGGFAADKKTAGDLNQLRTSAQHLDGMLAELQQLSKKGSTFSIDDRARAESLKAQAQMAWNRVAKLGALDKDTVAYLNNIIVNPLHMTELGEDAKLKAAREGVASSVKSAVGAANITPGVLQTRLDEKGNVVRQYAIAQPGARAVPRQTGFRPGTGGQAEKALKEARRRYGGK